MLQLEVTPVPWSVFYSLWKDYKGHIFGWSVKSRLSANITSTLRRRICNLNKTHHVYENSQYDFDTSTR